MKKRLILANVFLAMSMLLAIGLQSAHEIGHYREWQKERHCAHKETGASNLSHEHSKLEHCPICDFTFAHFTPSAVWQFQVLELAEAPEQLSGSYATAGDFFCGSLFALRAPPSLV